MGITGVAEPSFKSLLIYPRLGSLILDPKKAINSVDSSQKLVSQCPSVPPFLFVSSLLLEVFIVCLCYNL